MIARVVMLLLLLLPAACEREPEAPVGSPAAGRITGTIAYRERIILSSEAEVQIKLLDVSLADAVATTLGVETIKAPGLPPIDFILDYNPANIQERFRYVVRAEIRDGDKLVFTTDKAYPVLTGGTGTEVELMLVAVDHSPPSAAELLDTRWKLIAIESQPIVTKPPPDEAHLQLSSGDNTVAGYSGCNRFSGGFTRDGEALSFGLLLSTERACIDTMDLERSYLRALAKIDHVEIVERELRAFDGGELLLTFMAVDSP